MGYFAQFISFWILLSTSFRNTHSWSFDAYDQPIAITGPLREQFRPLTTLKMLRIETHEPWVRFVVRQSLATMLVLIVQLRKPTPSPVAKTSTTQGNNFQTMKQSLYSQTKMNNIFMDIVQSNQKKENFWTFFDQAVLSFHLPRKLLSVLFWRTRAQLLGIKQSLS